MEDVDSIPQTDDEEEEEEEEEEDEKKKKTEKKKLGSQGRVGTQLCEYLSIMHTNCTVSNGFSNVASCCGDTPA